MNAQTKEYKIKHIFLYFSNYCKERSIVYYSLLHCTFIFYFFQFYCESGLIRKPPKPITG